MEFVIIKENTPEYEFMWDWLGKHPLNKDLDLPMDAPNNGEQWQYMGTYVLGDRAVSELRHRNHPVTNSVENLSVSHSKFNINSIEQKTT